jgi:hypothetical protein
LLTYFNNIKLTIAIFARKNNIYKHYLRTDLLFDFNILILNISDSNIKNFQLINIYNEKNILNKVNF